MWKKRKMPREPCRGCWLNRLQLCDSFPACDSTLNFTLTCQVSEFVEQFPVQHELRKRILKRFQKERIEMPFPTGTVYVREQPRS